MKLLFKTFLISLCFIVTTIFVTSVHGWFSINKNVTITLSNISDPYWIDILIEKDEAPVYLALELQSILPDDYQSNTYKNLMNGYRTDDGFVSFRLYAGETFLFEKVETNKYHFDYYFDGNVTYKIAIIYPDGTLHISEPFTQTVSGLWVDYDLTTLSLHEYNAFQINHEFTSIPPTHKLWILPVGVLSIALLGIALFYAFGYRFKKNYIWVSIRNVIITIVSLGLIYLNYQSIYPPFPFITLFLIFTLMFIEMFIMAGKIKELHPKKAMYYILFSNILIISASFILHNLYFTY